MHTENTSSVLYLSALCVDDNNASLVEMVMYEVYSEDETPPMGCLALYHFVILVSVWGMCLLRRNPPLILPCPDQQVQSQLRYALKDSARRKVDIRSALTWISGVA